MPLHLAAVSVAFTRFPRPPEEKDAEFRVLDYLAGSDGELSRERSLRQATRASRKILDGMVRKKWIRRQDASAQQDAARTVKIAVLKSAEGKLNANQKAI